MKKNFVFKAIMYIIFLPFYTNLCSMYTITYEPMKKFTPPQNIHYIIQELKKKKAISIETIQYKLHCIHDLLNDPSMDVNINEKNENDETPLHAYLTENDFPENMNWQVVKFLLEHGAQIHTESEGRSLLFDALINPNISTEVIDLLVKYGFDITKPIQNELPLNLYLLINTNVKVEIIDSMINHGADINATDHLSILPPIMSYFAEENCNIKFDVVNYMIHHGANINYQDWQHRTPLSQAIRNPNMPLDIFILLVENGAQLSSTEKKHFTRHPNEIPEDKRNIMLEVMKRRKRKRERDFAPSPPSKRRRLQQ